LVNWYWKEPELLSPNLAHNSCPVYSGILKALEVEMGLALPRDVTIKFKEKL